MKEWRDNFLAFIAIITELLLGTLLFFIIIFLAHYLELAIARLDDPQGSIRLAGRRGPVRRAGRARFGLAGRYRVGCSAFAFHHDCASVGCCGRQAGRRPRRLRRP